MLKKRGMTKAMVSEGSHSVRSLKEISFTWKTIWIPIKMMMGILARGGIEAIIGYKKMEKRNNRLTIFAVSPLLPPDRMPIADSRWTAIGVVPMNAPKRVPTPSGIRSFLKLTDWGVLPAIFMSVVKEAVASKRETRKIEKKTFQKEGV